MNFYVETQESAGAATRAALYPTPGVSALVNAVTFPGRGCFAQNGRCFAVYGNVFYEVLSDWSMVFRGAMATNDNPAIITSNGLAGDQIFITSGEEGYTYDLTTNTFTNDVSDLTFCGFLDSFVVGLDTTNSSLRVSDANDATTWDPTQFAQRTTGGDGWVSMVITHREVWLFGSQTSEVWYDAGTSPYPLAPIPGAFIEVGCAAPFSAVNVDSTAMWLGKTVDGRSVVYRANGYVPMRVSTYAVEYAIQNYETVENAIGWTYQLDGHSFYVLNFPTANACWVYDTVNQVWHERGEWDAVTGSYQALGYQHHALMFDTHVTQDRITGALYQMGNAITTAPNGGVIRRMRRCPHLNNAQTRMQYPGLQLDLESGLGNPGGSSVTPLVSLKWSNDGGHTYGSEVFASAGVQGAYKTRVMWRRLGQARDRVFEMVMSDPTPWRITNAYLHPDPVEGRS